MERMIRVTGKGKVSVKPDMIQLGIEAGGLYSEYHEAVKRSAKETTLIRNAIAAAGIDPKGVKTDRFSVNTEYENYQDRNNNWKRRFTGYKYEHAMPTIKAEIRELSRDEAIILMVESNLQRSQILPSEKAFSYKMRLEATSCVCG